MPPPPDAIRAATEWLTARARWQLLEVMFWIVAFAAIYLFPDRHLILTEIAWLGLFALSPRLRRHYFVGPCRLFRHRRLHGRAAGQA
jgi:hypothetical protein